MEKRLLEIKDLHVSYGTVQALWGVSLHVPEGSIVALVGANGAGKSTLLKTVSGMNRPQKGNILFCGKDLTGLDPEEVVNAGVALVPEGRRLFARLTVKENLELGAYTPRARPFVQESMRQVYELFPLLQTRSKQISGSLSGGEQQMLAIARSMMSKPTILMLDEPSLGLSPLIVKMMFELVEELNRKGMTILLVEQNIFQALKISHYAYVIKTGKIVLEGPGEELLSDPEVQNAYLGALE